MAVADFQAGVAYVIALQRAQYNGGKHWLAGYDAAKDNAPVLTGDEFKKSSDSLAANRETWEQWSARLANGLDPWLAYGMLQIGKPKGTRQEMVDRWVEYAVANGIYVAGSRVTYGAAPADNVVGVHRRCTVTHLGQSIETGDHAIPRGIGIEVKESEATGAAGEGVVVEYQMGNGARRSTLRITGRDVVLRTSLCGPRSTGLATNAVLQGNADTADGDAITDGTATTGGISGWDQTRTGTPTVKARPNDAFGDQPYGIGIGKASATFKISQGYSNWDLQARRPVAYMLPVKKSGAAWEGDITGALGGVTKTWDETNLTNGQYVYLVSDLDENAYPEVFDDDNDLFSVQFAMGAFVDGGEEAILGGIYVMNGFQLQPGGEWHFCWENGSEPNIGATVSFSADTQTDDDELQEAWCRAFPTGPSLPITGSSLWSPNAGPAQSDGAMTGGQVSVAYSQSAAGTGGLGTLVHRVVAGSLPTGLSIASNGTISGTPSADGTFTFVVESIDALGRTDYGLKTITIIP